MLEQCCCHISIMDSFVQAMLSVNKSLLARCCGGSRGSWRFRVCAFCCRRGCAFVVTRDVWWWSTGKRWWWSIARPRRSLLCVFSHTHYRHEHRHHQGTVMWSQGRGHDDARLRLRRRPQVLLRSSPSAASEERAGGCHGRRPGSATVREKAGLNKGAGRRSGLTRGAGGGRARRHRCSYVSRSSSHIFQYALSEAFD